MLVYETYCWFSWRGQGTKERERHRACGLLLALLLLVYLHSGAAIPFRTAIARMAGSLLQTPVHTAALML
jgi:hypothetical protein